MTQTVLVTGATGLLGSHIVSQLLSQGINVKALARGKKADQMKSSIIAERVRKQLEVVAISDLCTDDLSDALKGVDGIIHTACPLPARANKEETFKIAVDGTLNIVRQAGEAGVKSIVVTGSLQNVMDRSATRMSLTDKDWNPITKEQGLASDVPIMSYAASKKFSELALWDWAKAHPEVDVKTVLPPLLYGSYLDELAPLPEPDYNALSSLLYIYNLLTPSGQFCKVARYADVRDVATAHIGALSKKDVKATDAVQKRAVLIHPFIVDFAQALVTIRKNRPELSQRLIQGDAPPLPKGEPPIVDYNRLKEVTDFEFGQYSFEQTLLDTVDSLTKLETKWKKAGSDVSRIPPMD